MSNASVLKVLGTWKENAITFRSEELASIKKGLEVEKEAYEHNRWKVLPMTCCGLSIGLIIAVASPTIMNTLSTTLYDRNAIDKVILDFVGGKKIS